LGYKQAVNAADLPALLGARGVLLGAEALPALARLRALVLAANERLNLTRITEESAFAEKHLLDSLLGLEGAPEEATWVDLGSGGGFPGLAIAVARPRARVLLVEAIQKKAAFLLEAAKALGLAHVEVTAERAEDAARSRRDVFDRATIRAVGTVALCLEYALPFVKPGGEAVLYRGPEDAASEDSSARSVAALLGGGEPRVREHLLPSGEKRRLIFVPKVSATPAGFPRRTGVAAKRPLG
jgi:16S rRNA (guanine527-N7)-methyltransferase